MADSLADLFVSLTADTSDFKEKFVDAAEIIANFSESAGGLGESLVLVGGLAAVATAAFETLKTIAEVGEQFEAATNKIITSTGAMGDSLESLEGTFSSVFTSVPQGMQDVATAIGTLQAILHPAADDLADLSTQLLNLSRITGESIAPLVTDTAHLFQQWGLNVEDGSKALDHFNQVAQATGTPVQQIEGLLTQFGPSLRNLGVDAGQAADLIGTLGQQGLNATNILGAMQRAEANLGKSGVTDLAAGFQQLVGAIQNASSAGQALQIGSAAFGARGSGPIVAAIQDGSIDFTTFQNQIDSTNESIDEQAQRIETLGTKWSTFLNQLETDLKPVASLVLDFLTTTLDAVEHAVDSIKTLWDVLAHPPTLPNLSAAPATQAQAEEIATLQALIAGNNKQVGAKQINVSPLDATGANILTATQYIDAMTVALGKTKTAAFDLGVTVKQNTDGTLDLSDAVDKTAKSAAASSNAFDQWLAKTTSGYKLLKEQLTNLQQAYQMQSGTGIIQLQIGNLQREVSNPNSGDRLTQEENYLNEKIKLEKAAGQTISDNDVAQAADDAMRRSQISMTTEDAYKLLGLPSPQDLDIAESNIQAALDKVTNNAKSSQDDISRATAAALDKDIALWRAAGKQIGDDTIQTAAELKATWAEVHMDIQQAFSALGVTSSTDAVNSLTIQAAALAKITASFNAGTATGADVTNAQIAALTKETATYTALGIAMSDADVSQLAYLQTQKQLATMTTAGAFTLIGMPSPDQVENNLALLTAAYAKVVTAVGDTGDQADAAWLDFLTKQVAQTQAAGQQVSDALAQSLESAQAQFQLDAVNVVNAFSNLGITSQQKLGQVVQLVQTQMASALATIATGSTQADQIVLAGLTQIQQAYQKSGTLVPQDIADQIQQLQAKLAAGLMTVQQAYTTLGVTSSAVLNNQITLQQHALSLIQESGGTIGEQLAGQQKLLASEIALNQLSGDDNTALIIQQTNAGIATQALIDKSNLLGNTYKGLMGDFNNAFTTLSKGIADNIIDAKNWGQVFSGIIDTIAKSILETLVGTAFKALENSLLTNTSLLQNFAGLLTQGVGVATNAVGGASGAAGGTGSLASLLGLSKLGGSGGSGGPGPGTPTWNPATGQEVYPAGYGPGGALSGPSPVNTPADLMDTPGAYGVPQYGAYNAGTPYSGAFSGTETFAGGEAPSTTTLAGFGGTAPSSLGGYANVTPVEGAAGVTPGVLGGDAASSGSALSGLSGIASTLSGLAGGNPIGAGIAAAAGITAGIQAEHMNNLLDEIEKSTRGELNQTEDIQNSLNQYLPNLVHLVDIWGAILNLGGVYGGTGTPFSPGVNVASSIGQTTQSGDSPVSTAGIPLVSVTDSTGTVIDPAVSTGQASAGMFADFGTRLAPPPAVPDLVADNAALPLIADNIQKLTSLIPAALYLIGGNLTGTAPIAVSTTVDAIKTGLLTPAQMAAAPQTTSPTPFTTLQGYSSQSGVTTGEFRDANGLYTQQIPGVSPQVLSPAAAAQQTLAASQIAAQGGVNLNNGPTSNGLPSGQAQVPQQTAAAYTATQNAIVSTNLANATASVALAAQMNAASTSTFSATMDTFGEQLAKTFGAYGVDISELSQWLTGPPMGMGTRGMQLATAAGSTAAGLPAPAPTPYVAPYSSNLNPFNYSFPSSQPTASSSGAVTNNTNLTVNAANNTSRAIASGLVSGLREMGITLR